MQKCPECKEGELKHDYVLKQYICNQCGLVFSKQDLIELRESKYQVCDDPHAKRRKEYLSWWLKSKK